MFFDLCSILSQMDEWSVVWLRSKWNLSHVVKEDAKIKHCFVNILSGNGVAEQDETKKNWKSNKKEIGGVCHNVSRYNL